MRAVARPRVHLFVCANARPGSPLGEGCADRGEKLYAALKEEVAARGRVADVWITKTFCLGVCPKRGATVARYPDGAMFADVEVEEARSLFDVPDAPFERELQAIEDLQTKKVLDLARRLKPGLTLEDIQNPHDFPELSDPDWHYADGVLVGIKTARAALRNRGGS
jgi:hypothetical protein